MRAHMSLELCSKAGAVLRQRGFILLCTSFGLGEEWRYTLFTFGNPALVWHVNTLHGVETTTERLIRLQSQGPILPCLGLSTKLPQTLHRMLYRGATRCVPFD